LVLLDPAALVGRLGAVASHLPFACLAAPNLLVERTASERVVVDFAPVALATPTLASGLHWALWAVVLAQAAWGFWSDFRRRSNGADGPSTPRRPEGIVLALASWLTFEVVLHTLFGVSLFLYSGHWVFAVVALAATGSESGRFFLPVPTLLALIALQLLANGGLVARLLAIYGQ
jgi:hypothetical protein